METTTTLTISHLVQITPYYPPVPIISQIKCPHIQTPHDYTTRQVIEVLQSKGFRPSTKKHKQTILFTHPVTNQKIELPKKQNTKLGKHSLTHIFKTLNETIEQLALRAFFS